MEWSEFAARKDDFNPPDSDDWAEWLRWAIFVMATDDRDLGFVASLLSYRMTRGALTDKQIKAALKVIRRLVHGHEIRTYFPGMSVSPAPIAPCPPPSLRVVGGKDSK